MSYIRVTVNVIKKCNLIKMFIKYEFRLFQWVAVYESLKTNEKTNW